MCCQNDHAEIADNKCPVKKIDSEEEKGKRKGALLPDHKGLESVRFRGNILPRGRNGRAGF